MLPAYAITSIFFTRRMLVGCTRPWIRRLRLRLLDFLVSKWLLKALYLRILPVPVTLNVFFARECVFIFGMVFKFGMAKVIKFFYSIFKKRNGYCIFFILIKCASANILNLYQKQRINYNIIYYFYPENAKSNDDIKIQSLLGGGWSDLQGYRNPGEADFFRFS